MMKSVGFQPSGIVHVTTASSSPGTAFRFSTCGRGAPASTTSSSQHPVKPTSIPVSISILISLFHCVRNDWLGIIARILPEDRGVVDNLYLILGNWEKQVVLVESEACGMHCLDGKTEAHQVEPTMSFKGEFARPRSSASALTNWSRVDTSAVVSSGRPARVRVLLSHTRASLTEVSARASAYMRVMSA